jgi:hypothetical protein
MKVPETIEKEWGIAFHKYMKKSKMIEVSGTDATLKPLDVFCFNHLKMMLECENCEPKIKIL